MLKKGIITDVKELIRLTPPKIIIKTRQLKHIPKKIGFTAIRETTEFT